MNSTDILIMSFFQVVLLCNPVILIFHAKVCGSSTHRNSSTWIGDQLKLKSNFKKTFKKLKETFKNELLKLFFCYLHFHLKHKSSDFSNAM